MLFFLLLNKNVQVYSFGCNSGQLGLGDLINRNTHTLIPGLSDIVSIATGEYFSLMLTAKGLVYTFGFNREGQLGLGQIQTVTIPTLIAELTNIVQIAAGNYPSLPLNNEGRVYSFGHNEFGQLGLAIPDSFFQTTHILISELTDIVSVSADCSNSLALDVKGDVYSFGSNNSGQLALGHYYNRYTH